MKRSIRIASVAIAAAVLGDPESIFANPKEERTKLFLSQVL